MSYLKKRRAAIYYAFMGLFASVNKEAHMKLHLLSTIAVTLAGFYFHINPLEWIAICICVVLVTGAELFNTAIEKLCDLHTAEIRPEVKYIKDISAGAVLLACIGALVTGFLVFGTRVYELIFSS